MNWQYLIVTLIILSAALYVGLMIYRKGLSATGKKHGKGGCDTGCGKCGG